MVIDSNYDIFTRSHQIERLEFERQCWRILETVHAYADIFFSGIILPFKTKYVVRHDLDQIMIQTFEWNKMSTMMVNMIYN